MNPDFWIVAIFEFWDIFAFFAPLKQIITVLVVNFIYDNISPVIRFQEVRWPLRALTEPGLKTYIQIRVIANWKAQFMEEINPSWCISGRFHYLPNHDLLNRPRNPGRASSPLSGSVGTTMVPYTRFPFSISRCPQNQDHNSFKIISLPKTFLLSSLSTFNPKNFKSELVWCFLFGQPYKHSK